jgi:hypothetical protein
MAAIHHRMCPSLTHGSAPTPGLGAAMPHRPTVRRWTAMPYAVILEMLWQGLTP